MICPFVLAKKAANSKNLYLASMFLKKLGKLSQQVLEAKVLAAIACVFPD